MNHLVILDFSTLISQRKKAILLDYYASQLFYFRRQNRIPPFIFFLEEARTNQLTEFPWAPYFNEVSDLINDDIKKETGFKESINSSLNNLMNKFDTDDYINRVLYLFIKIYLLEMLEAVEGSETNWAPRMQPALW